VWGIEAPVIQKLLKVYARESDRGLDEVVRSFGCGSSRERAASGCDHPEPVVILGNDLLFGNGPLGRVLSQQNVPGEDCEVGCGVGRGVRGRGRGTCGSASSGGGRSPRSCWIGAWWQGLRGRNGCWVGVLSGECDELVPDGAR
jgi:hypothetical protein